MTKGSTAAAQRPPELIGAAYAGCFSMALAGALGKVGDPPSRVETRAWIHFERVDRPDQTGGDGWVEFRVTRIALRCETEVDGVDEARLRTLADEVMRHCPTCQIIEGPEIELAVVLA